jgi:putative addiction module component (TIGR02574 family)
MESYNNLFKLSIAERLLLLEKLWDSIPANKIAVTKTQKAELNKRLIRLEKGETKFFTWNEVKKNLHKR